MRPLQPRQVLLLGWLGAQPRHFAKYAALWRRLGYRTTAVQPRTSSILAPPLGDRQAAHTLRLWREQLSGAGAGDGAIIHLFSNAGFIFFGTMLRALAAVPGAGPGAHPGLEEDRRAAVFSEPRFCPPPPRGIPADLLAPVRGVVLDSCPATMTLDLISRGFASALLGEAAAGIEARRPRAVSASRALLRPVLHSPYVARRLGEVWRSWDAVAPTAPQLYCYSRADVLIPPEEVELFMARQRARGVEVTGRRWRGSAHCAHLREHPEEYEEALLSFARGL